MGADYEPSVIYKELHIRESVPLAAVYIKEAWIVEVSLALKQTIEEVVAVGQWNVNQTGAGVKDASTIFGEGPGGYEACCWGSCTVTYFDGLDIAVPE